MVVNIDALDETIDKFEAEVSNVVSYSNKLKELKDLKKEVDRATVQMRQYTTMVERIKEEFIEVSGKIPNEIDALNMTISKEAASLKDSEDRHRVVLTEKIKSEIKIAENNLNKVMKNNNNEIGSCIWEAVNHISKELESNKNKLDNDILKVEKNILKAEKNILSDNYEKINQLENGLNIKLNEMMNKSSRRNKLNTFLLVTNLITLGGIVFLLMKK